MCMVILLLVLCVRACVCVDVVVIVIVAVRVVDAVVVIIKQRRESRNYFDTQACPSTHRNLHLRNVIQNLSRFIIMNFPTPCTQISCALTNHSSNVLPILILQSSNLGGRSLVWISLPSPTVRDSRRLSFPSRTLRPPPYLGNGATLSRYPGSFTLTARA